MERTTETRGATSQWTLFTETARTVPTSKERNGTRESILWKNHYY